MRYKGIANSKWQKSARGAVCCLHTSSLLMESLLPVTEILIKKENKYKCAHHSSHPVDDHHDVEDDDHDVEDGHHYPACIRTN